MNCHPRAALGEQHFQVFRARITLLISVESLEVNHTHIYLMRMINPRPTRKHIAQSMPKTTRKPSVMRTSRRDLRLYIFTPSVAIKDAVATMANVKVFKYSRKGLNKTCSIHTPFFLSTTVVDRLARRRVQCPVGALGMLTQRVIAGSPRHE